MTRPFTAWLFQSSDRASGAAMALHLVFAFCSMGCSSPMEPKSDNSGPVVSEAKAVLGMSLDFVALWWSKSQMEGLDPDSAPPKQTEVQLDHWDYSDPVGTPNPETFDVVVRLASGLDLEGLTISSERRWRVGPLSDVSSADWESWSSFPDVILGPPSLDGELDIRIASVDLESRQRVLFEKDRWPWSIEVRATVSNQSGALVNASRRLDIQPGD